MSGIGFGPSERAVAGRDRFGGVTVDPGAQAREHRGARRGGVTRDPHDRDPGDVRLDLVPDRMPAPPPDTRSSVADADVRPRTSSRARTPQAIPSSAARATAPR